MEWRLRTVVAALGLVAIGGTIGVLAATGVLGGSSDAAPQAAMRLDPASQTVSCSAEGATVQLFLDELAFRADPENADLAYGIGLFQIQFGYDPAILRIVDDAAIELNPALKDADPDADGVTRTWSLTTDIDDAAGETLIAGVSTVSGDAESLNEGGPSPEGGPLLLATIRLQTTSQGVSALTLAASEGEHPAIAEPQVSDPLLEPYEPVAVEEATITVEGGTCPEPPPLPTAEATATARPTVPPAPTSAPPETPKPVNGTPAHEGGRLDCPADWFVFADPDGRFSLCYPAGLNALSEPARPPDEGTLVNLRSPLSSEGKVPDGYFNIGVRWNSFSPYPQGAPNSLLMCPAPASGGERSLVSIALADGREASGCRSESTESVAGESRATAYELYGITMAQDGSADLGYLAISVNVVDPTPNASDLITRILETVISS